MYTTLCLKKLHQHPWATETKNGLFLVPTQYLYDISNPDATSSTDLGEGTGRQFATEEVFRRILAEGMRDPLYVSVYLPNPKVHPGVSQIRLEAGNHRVRAALEMGITHMPVAAFVSSNPYFSTGNGVHNFDINRNKVEQVVNRSPEHFEPYPHPIDLKALLDQHEVYYSKEVIQVGVKDGILKFY